MKYFTHLINDGVSLFRRASRFRVSQRNELTRPISTTQTGWDGESKVVDATVLGASNYTYAAATWTQGLAGRGRLEPAAFRLFCSVMAMIVPDNLKVGVTKPHRYEPDLNRTYAEMAARYGGAIPARARRTMSFAYAPREAAHRALFHLQWMSVANLASYLLLR